MPKRAPQVLTDNWKAVMVKAVGCLPPPPASTLLLAEDPSLYVSALETMGYSVRQSSLDLTKEYIQSPSNTRQGIRQFGIDLPEGENANFSVVIVLDLSPQIHPLVLFERLTRCTDDSALLLLVGLVDVVPPPRMERWFDFVVAIGLRCGFVEQALDGIETSRSGAGFVRALRKSAPPRWQLRHVSPENFEEIAALFHEVFGHPISRELWEWKYGHGRGNGVMAARQGVSVAHYGGIYRDVLLCGKPDWVFQICDVMVHPKERGVMTRQGPFLLTAATSAEIYGPLGFGFPNSRAMLVAEKMGLYSEVGQMVSVRWEPSPTRVRLRTRVHVVDRESASGRAQIDALWAAMAQDLKAGVVGLRDWKYVEQRYFRHPHNQYELLVVTTRLTRKPLGAMVLRRLDDSSCELLDVIAPLDSLPQVIDQARRMTGMWGLSHLYCWIAKNYAQRFVDCGGMEEPLNVSIPTSCWTHDERANVFKDKWWLMSGDTDFR